MKFYPRREPCQTAISYTSKGHGRRLRTCLCVRLSPQHTPHDPSWKRPSFPEDMTLFRDWLLGRMVSQGEVMNEGRSLGAEGRDGSLRVGLLEEAGQEELVVGLERSMAFGQVEQCCRQEKINSMWYRDYFSSSPDIAPFDVTLRGFLFGNPSVLVNLSCYNKIPQTG